MKKDPDLFDWKTHAEPAIKQALENSNEDWRDFAFKCVVNASRIHSDFTSDEVIRLLDEEPAQTHNLMALGGIFIKAEKQGFIENTGTTRQTTIKTRHRKLTVWRKTSNANTNPTILSQ